MSAPADVRERIDVFHAAFDAQFRGQGWLVEGWSCSTAQGKQWPPAVKVHWADGASKEQQSAAADFLAGYDWGQAAPVKVSLEDQVAALQAKVASLEAAQQAQAKGG